MKTLLLVLLLSLGLNAESISEKTAHGKELYKQCAACHGPYGAHRALGKSAIINVMSKENIMTALLGYKNGTYGGGMKGLMKGQVARYSYADLEAIVEYVVSLKELSSSPQPQYQTNTRNETQDASTPIAPSVKDVLIRQDSPDKVKIEMKAKRYTDNIVHVKAMIRNPMLTKDRAIREGIKQEFITRIIAKEDNKTVFDLISSEYLSKNPFIKFTYKSLGGSDLSIEATDNNDRKDNLTRTFTGDAIKLQAEIKSTGKEGKAYRVDLTEVNKILSNIKLLDTDRIQLVAPDVAANGGAVPINVHSDIKTKSVTLFATEEDAQMKFICQWRINEYSIIDYDAKIKMINSGNIKVILEGEDGKFYTTEKHVAIALGGGEA